jgi:ABC-2 type transport system ATP-binding protein
VSRAAISIRALSRTFRSPLTRSIPPVVALDAVTFDVEPGTVCGLLGPNGAGKTTLLEILATLLRPTAGGASVAGHDVVADAAAVRRCMAFGPAGGGAFFPRLSGRANLEFFAALADVGRAEFPARLRDAVALVRLEDAIGRELRTYSDGQRQRLTLARALVIDAPVWLLDEPTRGLDPAGQRETGALIRRAAAERGRTVLMATHDLAEAAACCDRIAIVTGGRLRALGTPAELAGRSGSLGAAYAAATGIDRAP